MWGKEIMLQNNDALFCRHFRQIDSIPVGSSIPEIDAYSVNAHYPIEVVPGRLKVHQQRDLQHKCLYANKEFILHSVDARFPPC